MPTTEIIPDEATLFRRIHRNHVYKGDLIPIAFQPYGTGERKGMSTDWEKYSTALECRNRGKQTPRHIKYGACSFITKDLRDIDLEVIHIYDEKNPAHTNVKGVDAKVRLFLLDLYKWEIKPRGC